MAETNQEVLDPGIKIEGEISPGSETPSENKEPQYSDVEVQAIEQGWRPKDEWDGDPGKWRDAATYIDRGELLGKLKSQSAELKEVKNMLSYMSDHNKKVYESGYQRAITDLKAQRIAAMKDDNFEAVAAIEDEIERQQVALYQVRQQPSLSTEKKGINKDLESKWLSENQWYKNDSAMKAWAIGAAMEYANVNNGASEEQIYDFLSKQVRKEFSHKFKKPSAPSPEGEGRQAQGSKNTPGKNASSAFKALLAEMPEEHARAARSMVKNGLVTEEKYVEDYARIGGR